MTRGASSNSALDLYQISSPYWSCAANWRKEYKINKKVIAKGTAAIVVYAIVIIDIIVQCTTSALLCFGKEVLKQ